MASVDDASAGVDWYRTPLPRSSYCHCILVGCRTGHRGASEWKQGAGRGYTNRFSSTASHHRDIKIDLGCGTGGRLCIDAGIVRQARCRITRRGRRARRGGRVAANNTGLGHLEAGCGRFPDGSVAVHPTLVSPTGKKEPDEGGDLWPQPRRKPAEPWQPALTVMFQRVSKTGGVTSPVTVRVNSRDPIPEPSTALQSIGSVILDLQTING